jgi:hypothetical protein
MATQKSNPIKDFLDPFFQDLTDKGWEVVQKVKKEAEQMGSEMQDVVDAATAKPFLITFTHGPYSDGVQMKWSQQLVYGTSFEHACKKIKMLSSEFPNAQDFKNQTIL